PATLALLEEFRCSARTQSKDTRRTATEPSDEPIRIELAAMTAPPPPRAKRASRAIAACAVASLAIAGGVFARMQLPAAPTSTPKPKVSTRNHTPGPAPPWAGGSAPRPWAPFRGFPAAAVAPCRRVRAGAGTRARRNCRIAVREPWRGNGHLDREFDDRRPQRHVVPLQRVPRDLGPDRAQLSGAKCRRSRDWY